MTDPARTEPLGPVELSLLEFSAGSFSGEIATELADLVERRIISILDLVIVNRAEDGELTMVELADADGSISERFDSVDGEVMWLLSDEDISKAAGALGPGTTGVLVLWENTWAESLRRAVGRSGGRLVLHERLDPRQVAAAMADTQGG